jgi:NAD(P)-dependent dehydrogenase (short-subunit alcohol dehydrogenase family)
VVSGASAGLGVETSRALAAAGASVIMLGRDEFKLQAAAQDLAKQLPDADIRTALADLADLDSIRACAADLLHRAPQIQLLINNAGVMACPLGRTAQGFELQFGTNHLGHFLLTCLLAPALLAGAPGRIVNLSSGGHKIGGVDFDDPNYQHRPYNKWQAYGQAKTSNVLFTVALEQRLGGRGVHALAVHPGVIQTELSRHLAEEELEAMKSSLPSGNSMRLKSIPQGAATTVWAASSPALEGQGGLYLEDCHIAAAAAPGMDGGVEAFALDPAAAEQLWALSERLVGERFDL